MRVCLLLQAVDGALLRLSGTEVRNCGQAFVLGRYCTHIHMGSRQEHSYIKDNSIHHSFQRAVVIHGAFACCGVVRLANVRAFRLCWRYSGLMRVVTLSINLQARI